MAKNQDKEIKDGQISGFDLYVSYENFIGAYKGRLQASGSYTFELSDTQLGKIFRIENVVSSIPEKVGKTKTSIETSEKRLNDISNQLSMPFEHTDELNQISRPKMELDSQLDIDKSPDDGVGLNVEPEMPPKITL